MNNLQKISKVIVLKESKKLFQAIASLIESTRERVEKNVNAALTLLNWQIGKHIDETLANTESNYGLEIVATLSPLLQNKFGKGYTTSSLHRTRRFFKAFPKLKIVATLSPLLSWSLFIELANVKNELARNYYTTLCKIEH